MTGVAVEVEVGVAAFVVVDNSLAGGPNCVDCSCGHFGVVSVHTTRNPHKLLVLPTHCFVVLNSWVGIRFSIVYLTTYWP